MFLCFPPLRQKYIQVSLDMITDMRAVCFTFEEEIIPAFDFSRLQLFNSCFAECRVGSACDYSREPTFRQPLLSPRHASCSELTLLPLLNIAGSKRLPLGKVCIWANTAVMDVECFATPTLAVSL